MKLFVTLGAALALAACAHAGAEDATLAAIKNARPAACPAGAAAENARNSGEQTAQGVVETVLSRTPLSNDAVGRTLRLRRLTIAPGGVIPWHEHAARQGLVYVVAGSVTEYRSDCRDPIVHAAGEIVTENAGLRHFWRNESGADAILFVFDAPPPA